MTSFTKHFKFIVNVSHKKNGRKRSFVGRWMAKRHLFNSALVYFGGVTAYASKGGAFKNNEYVVGESYVLEIGIRSNFVGPGGCHYKRAMFFANMLRNDLEQDSVYVIMPTGAGFFFKG